MTMSDIALGAALVNVGRELYYQTEKIVSGNNVGNGTVIDKIVDNSTDGSSTQNEPQYGGKKQPYEMNNIDFIEKHKQTLEEDIPSLLSLVQQYETILKAIEVQEEMKRKPIGFTPPQEHVAKST